VVERLSAPQEGLSLELVNASFLNGCVVIASLSHVINLFSLLIHVSAVLDHFQVYHVSFHFWFTHRCM
jgi:hypothetical protein